MVLPALPLIAAGLLGGAGGFTLSSLLEGTKKSEHITPVNVPITTPSNIDIEAWQYAPVQTYSPDFHYQIESPGATMITKKTVTSESAPSQSIKPSITPTITPEITAGTEGSNFTVLALIAAAAVIGYGLTTRGKEKK